MSREDRRERVFEALVDIVAGGGLPEFSIQEVADRAGVSHRTVYRYFPTREALLEALTEWVEDRMAARGGAIFPETVDDLPEVVRKNFALFDDDARAVEAVVRLGVGAAIESGRRHARSDAFTDVVRAAAPDGDNEAISTTATMVRQMSSSRMWLNLREAGLRGDAAAAAVSRAITALLDSIVDSRLTDAATQAKE